MKKNEGFLRVSGTQAKCKPVSHWSLFRLEIIISAFWKKSRIRLQHSGISFYSCLQGESDERCKENFGSWLMVLGKKALVLIQTVLSQVSFSLGGTISHLNRMKFREKLVFQFCRGTNSNLMLLIIYKMTFLWKLLLTIF